MNDQTKPITKNKNINITTKGEGEAISQQKDTLESLKGTKESPDNKKNIKKKPGKDKKEENKKKS